MKENIKLISFITLAVVVTILGIVNYRNSSIPLNAPNPTLKYNNNDIALATWEHTWIDDKMQGSSNLSENPFKLTENISPVKANPTDKISFNFVSKTKPKSTFISQWISPNEAKLYAEYKNVSNGELIMPSEKGTYIFSISGMWDETHTTHHVFKIIIH
ncbi:hypothetical protein CPJCM30710_25250 [Clostridium polyendosporum]|uniref:Uncharacterized protein n=1 Tax=Clostridium polyendosporum TaxID=69208 RepID=A0A919S0Z2_9CLOT|nr:hypothetical protein [Clostridium polyendosporum]GIM29859.1 hypothetical protein CPJCM30710_25250 [Clostridium polyendosporum]